MNEISWLSEIKRWKRSAIVSFILQLLWLHLNIWNELKCNASSIHLYNKITIINVYCAVGFLCLDERVISIQKVRVSCSNCCIVIDFEKHHTAYSVIFFLMIHCVVSKWTTTWSYPFFTIKLNSSAIVHNTKLYLFG